MTIFQALTRSAARLGHQPAVVGVDGPSGDRTELSFATLHNWVSKTANLLADDLDVGLGSEVGLSSPLHWLAPVVALAAWAAGAAVRVDGGGDVLVGHELDGGDVDLVLGSGFGGQPTADAGGRLTVADVLAQPDDFVDDPGDEGAWAIGGRTQATVMAEALDPSAGRLLHVGDRVDEAALFAIAWTLPVGVGLVLVRGLEGAALRRVADQEGVEGP